MRKLLSLGELTQHSTIPEWWLSRPILVAFLSQQPVPFTVTVPAKGDEYPPDVSEAVEKFLALGPTDRAAAAEQVFQYYRLYVDAVPEVDLGINNPQEIWSYVTVRGVSLQRKGSTGRYVYVLVECDCDWDDEHGLQLLYRSGHKLEMVGEQDGGVTYAQDKDAEQAAPPDRSGD